MNRTDRYKQVFTKDYLMGPNSFRLLDELIRRNPYSPPRLQLVCFSGTMRMAVLIPGFRGVNSEYALCISLSSSLLIDSFPTFLKI